MHIRTTAAATVLLLATLTACGGSSGDDANKDAAGKPASSAKPSKISKPKVDCSDQSLSQADWMKYCSDKAGTGGDGGKSTGLKFGESYTWPDGLKVTVIEAKVFTDYDKDLLESPSPGSTDFRVKLKLENTGKAPAALDKLSTIVEGATNGGEASSTSFNKDSAPLEGRLAPGVSAVKTDDNTIESKYGKKIVVTVQRASDNFDLDFPEFSGEITG
ncbi:MAG: hypothetical protein HOZ81_32785 [Streptomyces sp.]|nr:hypothetical protein [Streptomyces sp.]NUS89452.1 hypothetical protein [Streptomyces sp.]